MNHIIECLRAANRVEFITVHRQNENGLARVGWILSASSGEVSVQPHLGLPRPNGDIHTKE
jgi:hypothetical protein